jgi:hypothetical protein
MLPYTRGLLLFVLLLLLLLLSPARVGAQLLLELLQARHSLPHAAARQAACM